MTLELEACGGTVVVPGNLGMVLANQSLLEQILTNLFGNGLKFVETGVVPRIEGVVGKEGSLSAASDPG